MVKILLYAVRANNFPDTTLINAVEFITFVLIFLIAVFIAYLIYRSKKRR